MSKRVATVLLNWNGWGNTLECLESVFRSDYPEYRVIVCDNGLADGSFEQIRMPAVHSPRVHAWVD